LSSEFRDQQLFHAVKLEDDSFGRRFCFFPLRPAGCVGIFFPYVVTKSDDQPVPLSEPARQQDRSNFRTLASSFELPKLAVMGAVISWAMLAGSGCAAAGGQFVLPTQASSSGANGANVAQAAPQSRRVEQERPTAVRASEARINTIVTATDAAAWRLPTASPVEDVSASSARCPAEMALVEGRVCVDRWEASIVERLADGTERSWSPYLPVDGHESSVRAVSRPHVVPQGYISGEQGARACRASGKRLCGADEWERACRGPQKTAFPYGNERTARVCNDDNRATHPVVEVARLLHIPEDRLWFDGMNQSLINQLPNGLLEAGERAECTNDYGVFDMVGNLHEWVDDREGTFRGGYYMDTSLNGEGCSYATTAHDFSYHDYSTGFRCCMDPDRVE